MPIKLNEEAWSDFGVLIDAYLDASEQILQKDKYLVPMAMIMRGREPVFIALQPENEESYQDTKNHLVAYRQLLQNMPDNAKACILGYDIKVQYEDYRDAIAIELEHTNGTHQKMFVPYKFTGIFKNKLQMGQSKLIDPEPEHILHRQ